jgi:hypothetical protein
MPRRLGTAGLLILAIIGLTALTIIVVTAADWLLK